MIYINDGMTDIHGDEHSVLAELTVAIKAIYNLLEKNHGKEFAYDAIAFVGRLAFASEEDLDKELKEGGVIK